MLNGTITVKYVNPPKAGKKRGSVKTDDDQLYGVWPELMDLFQPGGVYDIVFEETVSNGETYRNIKKAKLAPARYPAKVGQAASGFASGLPDDQRSAPVRSAAPKGDYYKETSPRDAERMFVCSILNAAIQAGQLYIDDIPRMKATTEAFLSIWRETFGVEDKQPGGLRRAA
jgi:hypothetical protein